MNCRNSSALRSAWISAAVLAGALAIQVSASAAGVTLTWSDNCSRETGFAIERATSQTGTYTQIAVVGSNVTTYNDTTGTAGTTYYYRVKAYTTTWNSGYSNIASKTFPVSVTYTKLTGTVIGTTGSYNNSGNDRTKVFDNNTSTYFDAAVASGAWAGLDITTAKKVTKVRFYPRASFAGRMTGGKFQGSNDQSTWTDLYTISGTPAYAWTDVTNIGSSSTFRYLRYLSPANSYGNVAEVEFYTSP